MASFFVYNGPTGFECHQLYDDCATECSKQGIAPGVPRLLRIERAQPESGTGHVFVVGYEGKTRQCSRCQRFERTAEASK